MMLVNNGSSEDMSSMKGHLTSLIIQGIVFVEIESSGVKQKEKLDVAQAYISLLEGTLMLCSGDTGEMAVQRDLWWS
jgi:hypothetical protein